MIEMKPVQMGAGVSRRHGFVLTMKVELDMKQLQDLIVIMAHEGHIIDLAFTQDSCYLLSAGMDNLVKQWSTDDWSLEQTYVGHEKSVNSVSLMSGGGRFITASSDRSLFQWELGTTEPLEKLAPKGSITRISRMDHYIVALDSPWLTVLDYNKREILDRFKPFPKRTTAMAFSPDEKWLAAGGQGDVIRLYDLPEVEQSHEISQAHEGFVLSLAFSPDGRQLVSIGYEKELHIWESKEWHLTGKVRLENQGVQSLTFSPNGEVIAVASDHRVTLVNAGRSEIFQEKALDPKGVYCLAFSPDGKWLACGSADKRLRIWKWA